MPAEIRSTAFAAEPGILLNILILLKHQHSQELILFPCKMLRTCTLQFESLLTAESSSLPSASQSCGISIPGRGSRAPTCHCNGTEAYGYFSALTFLKRSRNHLSSPWSFAPVVGHRTFCTQALTGWPCLPPCCSWSWDH